MGGDKNLYTFKERYSMEMYEALQVPEEMFNECGDTYIDYKLCLMKNDYMCHSVSDYKSVPLKIRDKCFTEIHNLNTCRKYQRSQTSYMHLVEAYHNNREKATNLSPTFEKYFKPGVSFN